MNLRPMSVLPLRAGGWTPPTVHLDSLQTRSPSGLSSSSGVRGCTFSLSLSFPTPFFSLSSPETHPKEGKKSGIRNQSCWNNNGCSRSGYMLT